MDERSTIAGIGPISVDPDVQNSGAGRAMMQHMLDRVAANRLPGVRLVQTAYHNRSLSLYAKLGFEIREPLSVMVGTPINERLSGYVVRPATDADLDACNRLCAVVHGHDRGGELRGAIKGGTAAVVEHLGRITGYATAIGYAGHAVGESNEELKALISSAREFLGVRPADPVAQRRTAPMVLQQGPAPDAADDADERRPLQRAALPVHPVDSVLAGARLVRRASLM